MSVKFSILVPAYNRERLIVDCLQSIKNQSYTNYEVFLVDNESSDNITQDGYKINFELYDVNTTDKGFNLTVYNASLDSAFILNLSTTTFSGLPIYFNSVNETTLNVIINNGGRVYNAYQSKTAFITQEIVQAFIECLIDKKGVPYSRAFELRENILNAAYL